jgi:dTMP kinase
MTGIFIVFEGGEGAGKTTQAACLAQTLAAAGHPVTLTSEPGGTAIGARIRNLLLCEPPPSIPAMTEFLLFAADRAAHVEQVLRPALDRGDIVVCDRYIDSSVAYQGAGRGLQQVRLLAEVAAGFLQPDLVVVLDVEPVLGLKRVSGRAGAVDRIEQEDIEFHDRVRHAFLTRATAVTAGSGHLRYMVVDASQPETTIAAAVAGRVRELLLQKAAGTRRKATL